MLALAFVASAAAASDVVVLRGGTRIELKSAPMRQGNNVLLTRKDGTLLSVPFSEIDTAATAAAKAAPAPAANASAAAAPVPQTLAEAARAAQGGPKARVRLTDADVGHELAPTGPGDEAAGAAAPAGNGDSRVDVADYSQSKAGDNLIVKGVLRNLGTRTALNVRLSVTPHDEKGQPIDTVEASVSNGTLEAGKSVGFTATVPVGKRNVGVMQFSPRWTPQATPAEVAAAAAAAGGSGGTGAAALPGAGGSAAAPPAASRPAPTPVPYGQGTLYAAPAPNAPSVAPADGKTGYIPGAASPDNQPKPPE
jgi:hypothetical protein